MSDLLRYLLNVALIVAAAVGIMAGVYGLASWGGIPAVLSFILGWIVGRVVRV